MCIARRGDGRCRCEAQGGDGVERLDRDAVVAGRRRGGSEAWCPRLTVRAMPAEAGPPGEPGAVLGHEECRGDDVEAADGAGIVSAAAVAARSPSTGAPQCTSTPPPTEGRRRSWCRRRPDRRARRPCRRRGASALGRAEGEPADEVPLQGEVDDHPQVNECCVVAAGSRPSLSRARTPSQGKSTKIDHKSPSSDSNE